MQDMTYIKAQRIQPKYKTPFRDYKGEIFHRLAKYEFICTKESEMIRRYAHEFIKNGYPIRVMHCDCEKYDRKHNAYYYEWALDIRP